MTCHPIRVMVCDVGAVVATIGFGALLFLVVIVVCVLLLALIAKLMPRYTPPPDSDSVDGPGGGPLS